jgi:hypothetical protein
MLMSIDSMNPLSGSPAGCRTDVRVLGEQEAPRVDVDVQRDRLTVVVEDHVAVLVPLQGGAMPVTVRTIVEA